LKTIGVTGGIGSGKSTVSRTLRNLGAVVVDADQIARMIAARGGNALEELVSYFGNTILDERGELDRKRMADTVFNDQVKLHALDSITHKYIAEKIADSITNLKAAGKTEIVVIDAPLPVEHGFMDLTEEVWVVTCKRETRIKRVMERGKCTYEEVLNRINTQIKDEEYLKIADEVLPNDGSVEELEKAVVKLFISKKQDWQR
jgi:dephospho-CoA kinase